MGWITECGGLNCTLYSSVPGPAVSDVQTLTIGRRAGFDQAVTTKGPGWITFRARVHRECIGVTAVCLGRPEMLEPLSNPR